MEDNQNQNLNKSEHKELRRQEKIGEKAYFVRRRWAKKIIKIFSVLIATGGGFSLIIWFIGSQPAIPPDQIISSTGIHWHPELSINIKGQLQDAPAGIGLGVVHNPIHTHEADGILHLEFSGAVKKDDLRLARFFEIWGKKFNKDCVFEYCNGSGGVVKFFVNGKENPDFENYIMQDKDKLEIKYE